MIARQTAVQAVASFKGHRERIVSVYNEKARPLPRGYRIKAEDQLCASLISAGFLSLDWQDLVPPECGAMQLYKNMDALGRAVMDGKRVPEVGDLIFFGSSPKVNHIQHVGIVSEVVNNKQIYYWDIQANVGRHTCPVGYAPVVGYAMPDYASKDLAPIPTPEPEPTPDTPHVFAAGDLVTINPGARWYRGQSIPLNVISDKWYICSIRNDRAVLGMNLAETRNIQSPIHTCDITLVTPNEPVVEPADDTVTLTITVNKDTAQLLQILADGQKCSIGEWLDKYLEDAR